LPFYAAALLITAFISVTGAEAACAVIQKSATASTAQKATQRAISLINRELKPLKRQHGKKLVLSQRAVACLGGAASIDVYGTQHYGNPSCTVTQPFCVNP
jgi:hypothetical protein